MVNKDFDEVKGLQYVKNDGFGDRIFRVEILLAPLLVFAPLLVGLLLIHDWYVRDFLLGNLDLFRELLLGIIIITGNIIFDIPFLNSLIVFSRYKKLKK